MIGFVKDNVTIGVGDMPYRKKPCLVIVEGNSIKKYATFNNEEAAAEFMEKFGRFLGVNK